MESVMRRFILNALVMGLVWIGMAASLLIQPLAAADIKDDPGVLQADHALVGALGKTDKAAAEKFSGKVKGMKACYFGDPAETVETLRAMIGSVCTHACLVLPKRVLVYHPLKKVADAIEDAA